ncbi:MAG: integrase catalytic domain-containing protein, partial [Waterburya sp.]
WIKYRNLKYLGKYLDGYLNQKYIVDQYVQLRIKEIVENHPGISLSQLLEKIKLGTIDDVNALIANTQIYVDLSVVSLTDHKKVKIFRDEATAQAYITASVNYSQPVNSSLQTVDIKVGSSFLLDGKCLTVDHMGDSKIILSGQEGLIQWTHQQFQQLVELEEITNFHKTEETQSLDSLVNEYFNSASPQALAEANRRYSILEPYLKDELSPSPESDTPQRTIRYWKAKYKKAQQEYGCGFIGLIPQRQGNPTSRYSAEDLAFVDEIIDKEYESFKQKKVWAVYEILKARWNESNRISPVPSHTFLYQRIKNRPKHKTIRKRKGSRAANNFLGPWLIQPTTPRHGDRPFEIVHIDHTLLEIECICPESKVNLGRPWVTAMIDAYSRRILAVYLTFDAPSYRSCMMLLRICVQRFKRFPEWIVVDNGKDFQSTYFDTLLARFEASKKHRPKDVPKFSSIIERWFRTTETEFFNNLRGNTQIMKEVRLVKKQNNPKNLAVWELDELYNYFVSGYCYGVYDRKEHPALEGMSPQQTFEFGITKTGSRPHQTIKYDEQFKILTLPSTPKGTA